MVVTPHSVRAYERGGLLEGEAAASFFASSSAGSSGSSGSSSVGGSRVTAALPLDSADSIGLPSTMRTLVGTNGGGVYLLDTSRLWETGAAAAGVAHRSRAPVRALSSATVAHSVDSLTVVEGKAIVAASGSTGEVTLLDPSLRTPAPVARYTAHVAGVASMAGQRGLLLSAGYLSRGAAAYGSGPLPRPTFDPHVKVFDLRAMRAASPLHLVHPARTVGPMHLTFMPASTAFSASAAPPLLITCSDGRLLWADAFGDGIASLLTSIDPSITAATRASVRGDDVVTDSTYRLHLVAASLSPSGRTLAAADADGCVHIISAEAGAPASMFGLHSAPAALHAVTAPWLDSSPATWMVPDVATVPPTAPPPAPPTTTAPAASRGGAPSWAALAAAGSRGAAGATTSGSSGAGGSHGLSDLPPEVAPTDAVLYAGNGWECPVDAAGGGELGAGAGGAGGGGGGDQGGTGRAAPARGPRGPPPAPAGRRRGGGPPRRPLVSTTPDGWNDKALLPPKAGELDPALLAFCDKGGAFIDNKQSVLQLPPNSLVFGRRRGYVDVDLRHREPGKSSLGAATLAAAASVLGGGAAGGSGSSAGEGGAAGGGGGGGGGVRARGDSLSSTSSSLDLEAMLAGGLGDDDDGGGGGGGADDTSLVPTAAFRMPVARASAANAFETDFAHDNGTPYAGLETIGAAGFLNAPVQLLFFLQPLRRRLQQHLCTHPACIACELRFLFDILCQAPCLPAESRVTSTQNLARALQHASEFRRLALLHPCTLEPPRRAEMVLRSLLERVAKELEAKGGVEGSGAAPVLPLDPVPVEASSRAAAAAAAPERLFGVPSTTVTTCAAGHTACRDGVVLAVDVMYPAPAPAPATTAAAAAAEAAGGLAPTLAASLAAERRTRAWCEECKAYVPLTQRRHVASLPPLLLVNTNTSDAAAAAYWRTTPLEPRLHIALTSSALPAVTPLPLLPPAAPAAAAGSAEDSSAVGGSGGGAGTPPAAAASTPGRRAGGGGGVTSTGCVTAATYSLVGVLFHVRAARSGGGGSGSSSSGRAATRGDATASASGSTPPPHPPHPPLPTPSY